LDEESYQSLISHADVIIVLTKKEYLLLCGAYEAISASRPLILSHTKTISEYFKSVAIYCENEPSSISAQIKYAISNKIQLESMQFKAIDELKRNWNHQFDLLIQEIYI
jgi:trehalose-6-phosphate synthase